MSRLMPILLSLLIVGLFLYSKLLPYKDKLNPQYKKIFDFFNRITKKELVFGKESKSKTTFNNKRNVYGDEIG